MTANVTAPNNVPTPSSETRRKLSFSYPNNNGNLPLVTTKNILTSTTELLLDLLIQPDNSRYNKKGRLSSGLLRNTHKRQLTTSNPVFEECEIRNDNLMKNDRYFSWYRILAERCREFDDCTNQKQNWQRKLLLSFNNNFDGGYTPLHQAVFQGDLRMILFLLQQSALPSSSSKSTFTMPLKHVVQSMLSERKRQTPQQQQRRGLQPSDFDNLLLSQAVCQIMDDEGFTPGELLVQLQRNDLRQCRRMIMAFSNKFTSNNIRSRRRARSISVTEENEQELQTQNEFEYLSRAVAQLTSEQDRDNEVASGDEDNSDDHRRRSRVDMESVSSVTFGCEVLTFGSAHHCVLGVGKANYHHQQHHPTTKSSPSTTSNTANMRTETTTSVRPQRVVEFSMDIRRAQHDSAIRIAAAQHHTLVVTQQGHLYAFGLGKSGRLGTGAESPCPVPTRIVGSLQHQKVIGVAAAENHSLAVTSTGHVYAWGSNRFGQLGYTNCKSNSVSEIKCSNESNCTMLPRRVDGELKGIICTQVAAGARHSVALTDDGIVYVWGDNSSGQLGVVGTNPKIQLLTALLIGGSANINNQGKNIKSKNSFNKKVHVTQIAASDYSTLVLGRPPFSEVAARNSMSRANKVNVIYSWGHGNHNPTKVQFPDHFLPQQCTETKRNELAADDDLSTNAYRPRHSCKNMLINPINIACARYHNVAITDNGYVYTWGLHSDSLGTSSPTVKSSQPPATPKSKIVPSNKGNNSALQTITEPQLVVEMLPENGGGTVVAVSASEHHTAVITDTGDLYTWGESYQPMVLGHAGVRFQPSPKRVPSVHRAVGVSVAKEHTVVLMGTTFPARTILPVMECTEQSVQQDDFESETTRQDAVPSTTSGGIPTLENLASLAVMERIDVFNVLPVLVVAERTQNPILLDYCYEFIRRNLDGVLNVGQRSVLDSYLNEQLNGNTSNICISTIQIDSDLEYRDDDLIHPMAVNVLTAGSLRTLTKNFVITSSSSLFTHKATCSLNEWIEGCNFLLQEPTAAKIISSYQIAKQNEKRKTENAKHAFRRNRSLSNVSDTSDSGFERRARSDSFNCYRITDFVRCIETEVSSSEGLHSKHAMIVKEIRAVRKRLGQIERLETSQSRSDIAYSSSPLSSLDGSSSALTTEQQQKLWRRPQLISDLSCLEKAKATVEMKMQELRGRALVESARKIVESVEAELASTVARLENGIMQETKEKTLCRKVSFVEEELTKKDTTKDYDTKVLPIPKRFYCDVCLVTCPDKNSMDLHMSGRKHRNRVAQVDEEEKQRATEATMEAQRKRELLKVVPTPTSKPIRASHSWATSPSLPSPAFNSQPKYCLPPPPHPVSDVVVTLAVPVAKMSPPMKAKTLKEIMEEEAKNKKTKPVLPSATKPKTAASIKLASPSPSKGILQPPPGSNKTMKSPPLQSSSTKSIDVSCSSLVTNVKPAPASRPSLASFIPTPQVATPRVKESQSPSIPWKSIPTQDAIKVGPIETNVAQSPAAVSFKDIQEQELESKKYQEDQTTYIPDGKNKWYIEKRNRAGSFNEIQSETMKLEEERAMINEQFAIERQIMAEIEAKKKALERKEKRKKKKMETKVRDCGDNLNTTLKDTAQKNDLKQRRRDYRGKKLVIDNNTDSGKVGSG